MKKQWLPLVFAVFLLLAPVAAAADGSAPGWLEQLVDQIMALWVGDDAELLYTPSGANLYGDGDELGHVLPPHG